MEQDASSGGRAAATMVPDTAQILDLLPGLVAFFDADLRYGYANACYARWRGIAPADLVGRTCREVVGEAQFPLIRARLLQALAGEAVTSEYWIFDAEHRRRVQGSYVPHRDPDGTVRGVIVLVTDISQRDDLHQRVRESEATFEQAFRNSPIGMAVCEPSGHIIRPNASFAAMLGYSADELGQVDFRDITHPDDLDADLELYGEVIRGERDGYQLDKRYIHRDGSVVQARMTVSAARDADGTLSRLVAHVEDVTQRNAAEQRLRRGAARLGLAMDAIRGGFWHMDVQTGVFETSAQLSRFATGEDTPLGLAGYCARIDPRDLPQADLSPLLDGRVECVSAEYRLHTADGVRWARCDRRLVRDDQGRPEQVVGVVLDVTEERLRERAFETEAETDTLTGLLNRRGFERHLSGRLGAPAGGVLAVDLDRFKQVNDRFGHAAGDAVLIEVARRLRQAVRDSDLVCRLGGDEFLVAMPGASRAQLGRVAQRVAESLRAPFAVDGTELPVGGSVGASWSTDLTQDAPGIIARADRALYAVKSEGRGTWRLAG